MSTYRYLNLNAEAYSVITQRRDMEITIIFFWSKIFERSAAKKLEFDWEMVGETEGSAGLGRVRAAGASPGAGVHRGGGAGPEPEDGARLLDGKQHNNSKVVTALSPYF